MPRFATVRSHCKHLKLSSLINAKLASHRVCVKFIYFNYALQTACPDHLVMIGVAFLGRYF